MLDPSKEAVRVYMQVGPRVVQLDAARVRPKSPEYSVPHQEWSEERRQLSHQVQLHREAQRSPLLQQMEAIPARYDVNGNEGDWFDSSRLTERSLKAEKHEDARELLKSVWSRNTTAPLPNWIQTSKMEGPEDPRKPNWRALPEVNLIIKWIW